MTAARDWLIELLKQCSLHWKTAEKCADEIIAASPDAPDSVRLELAALLNTWRLIDDDQPAPKDGAWILVAYGVDDADKWPHQAIVQWRTTGRRLDTPGWYDDRIFAVHEPTHWLPLPAPPSEDKA